MSQSGLKEQVREYWSRQACGTGVTAESKFTRQYFDEIEEYRYAIEPEIFSFAQFTRYAGKRVLEVGIGAGTDFLQWVRAGTEAHGIDLTQEAVDHVTHRLAVYGLKAADVRVADAENLPFPDDSFDLIYSWGVIHHSPNTEKAFAEIVRCVKRGGAIKLMLYHRHSLYVFYRWLASGLLRGRLMSLSDVLYQHQESIGTKAYTRSEVSHMAERNGAEITKLDVTVSPYYDLLCERNRVVRFGASVLAGLMGRNRCGWYMRIDMRKS